MGPEALLILVTTAILAVGGAGSYLIARFIGGRRPQLPGPTLPETPPLPNNPEPEVEEEEEVPDPAPETKPPPPPKVPELAPSPDLTSWDTVQKEWEEELHKHNFRLRDVIEELCGHVKPTRERILVGHRVTGAKAIGYTVAEVPYPADQDMIRPIRGFHEAHRLLPSERALPLKIRRARIASGEALVSMWTETTAQMEDIHEPEYKVVLRTLDVLWDCSPSMKQGSAPWRGPVWKGVLLRLLEKAIRSNVPFNIRAFGGRVSPRAKVVTPAQALKFRKTILQDHPTISDTNIGAALARAIRDHDGREYTEGEIVIVTDGEDNHNLNPKAIRAALEKRRLRLHSIMLGVKNDSLRACSDVYQIVEKDLTVRAPVRRSENHI